MNRTEMRNPRTKHIDKLSTREILEIINDENKAIITALNVAIPEIEKACDMVSDTIQNNGRVFYLGAGTSGRLGIADAAECPPTFGVPDDLFNGIIAGGNQCVFKAGEGAEDNAELGVQDLKAHHFSGKDIAIGISASGGAAYVAGALAYANSLGAKTVAITNNPDTRISRIANVTIFADTGEEVITGSTRMKAGTSQKIILNMISTVSMIKNGYVYENLMINLKPRNIKLRNRMIGIVMEITGESAENAERLLEVGNWDIKTAIKKEEPYQ